MKISVILAHPDQKSFNHAMAAAAIEALHQNGHAVFFHDLYAEKFDPVLPAEEIARHSVLLPEIESHCKEISRADGIIVIHPNWWGQPPAILKGWVDRVIRPGVAYEFLEGDNGEGIPNTEIPSTNVRRFGRKFRRAEETMVKGSETNGSSLFPEVTFLKSWRKEIHALLS